MAPEVAHGRQFNEKADLWSLGIILFEMIAGKVPFKGTTHLEILQLIDKGQYSLPEGIQISQVCKNMITSLIMTDVEIRINFKDFGKHPFTSLSPEEYKIFVEKSSEKIKSQQNTLSHVEAFEPVSVEKDEKVEEPFEEIKVNQKNEVEISAVTAVEEVMEEAKEEFKVVSVKRHNSDVLFFEDLQ